MEERRIQAVYVLTRFDGESKAFEKHVTSRRYNRHVLDAYLPTRMSGYADVGDG